MIRLTRFIVLALAGLLLAGCVERTLEITTDPGGALVYLNDEEVGRTPLTVPFTYYGKYDVRVEADGYKPLWTTAHAKAPAWEYPGPDLVAEAIPNAKSVITWHFALEPAPAVEDADPDALLSHAQQMRALTREKQSK